MSHYIVENHEFGELRGVYTSSTEDQFMIDDAIDMTSDFDERFMTDFLTVVEQNFERVSFLTKIYVNPEHRGHGFGHVGVIRGNQLGGVHCVVLHLTTCSNNDM